MAHDPYLVLGILIALCTNLLLRCLLSDRYGQIMLFLLILRMLIYILILLSITITFYGLFGNKNLSVESFAIWASPRVFTSLSKPTMFLCRCRGFYVKVYVDDYPGLYFLRHADKMAQILLCLLVIHLGLHINFPKPEPHLT